MSDTLSRVTTQDPEKVRRACEALLEKAAEGDIAAFREIFDRLEGKPTQMLAGDPENPLITQIVRQIVHSDDKNG